MKHYTIYKITNIINNKIYIGKHITNDICDNYMGSGKLLKYAKQKYGIENFKKEILYDFETEKEMNETEAKIVNEEFLKDKKNIYNICVGGNGGWTYVNKNNKNIPIHKQKNYKEILQKAAKARNKTVNKLLEDPIWKQNFKNKVSEGLKNRKSISPRINHWLGKKHSEETKLKIAAKNSISLKGDRNPWFGKCWIYNKETYESIRIKKEELNAYLSDGWCKGRKINLKNEKV